jgi:hypothetical protein
VRHDRREIEHELERVAAQLRFQADILANVRDSVIVTDLEGRILYCNHPRTGALASGTGSSPTPASRRGRTMKKTLPCRP